MPKYQKQRQVRNSAPYKKRHQPRRTLWEQKKAVRERAEEKTRQEESTVGKKGGIPTHDRYFTGPGSKPTYDYGKARRYDDGVDYEPMETADDKGFIDDSECDPYSEEDSDYYLTMEQGEDSEDEDSGAEFTEDENSEDEDSEDEESEAEFTEAEDSEDED